MNKKIFFILLLFYNFIGCSASDKISGTIVPEWHGHSYQGQFQFTEYSHAIIKLHSEESADHSTTLSTHRINNIKKFPIYFSIPLPSEEGTGKLRISAQVISGKNKRAIEGDFITEEVTYVNRSSSTTVKVVGLESCDAPNKGGFCSDTSKSP